MFIHAFFFNKDIRVALIYSKYVNAEKRSNNYSLN